ncbi:hypothetical protein ACFL1B_06045 [Nanoarchaeota archaeon]
MSSKKGIEMSIQLVIVAALALLILVIVVLIMSRSSGTFSSSVNECDERGSGWTCSGSCPSGTVFYSRGMCPNDQVCCAPEDEFGGRT